jgi:predicted nuclease of predicted toxin-antitoxin system
MRFIVGAQLPPALARWLSANGHMAEHVGDFQMGAASDREIWDLALRMPAIIVTKNGDFHPAQGAGAVRAPSWCGSVCRIPPTAASDLV